MASPAQERFKEIIKSRVFSNFIIGPKRSKTQYALDEASLEKVSDLDAKNFISTIDAGLLREVDGDFYAPMSHCGERLLNHGPKKETPRALVLWLEPVIGIGAVGRLVNDFGWPIGLIGMQSKKSALDLVCYDDINQAFIACEIKINSSSIRQMCTYFEEIFYDGLDISGLVNSKKLNNWNNKARWIQEHRPKIFWALGPENYCKIYRVTVQAKSHRLFLEVAGVQELEYSQNI